MVFNMPALIKFIVNLFKFIAKLFKRSGVDTPEVSNEILSKVDDAVVGWLDSIE
ncbi:MAG: hypothetical protein K6C36_09120 [Clostridia bacterium]|nr:hypothetical protein [Clostridia bacterium]